MKQQPPVAPVPQARLARPPHTSEMVLNAVRKLAARARASASEGDSGGGQAGQAGTVTSGARPRDVVRYIQREYNVRARWVKSDVTSALRWGVEFGLLRRPQRGLYVPADPADPAENAATDTRAEAEDAARREGILRRACEGFRQAGELARARAACLRAEPTELAPEHRDAATEEVEFFAKPDGRSGHRAVEAEDVDVRGLQQGDSARWLGAPT